MRSKRGAWVGAATVVALGCSSAQQGARAPATETFRQVSDDALATMQTVFYDDGNWRMCVPKACSTILPSDDFDWGADSMTAALYLRWSIAGDASIVPMMKALDANGATYASCTTPDCVGWSDVPLWDSVAAAHEHLVTGASRALQRAEAAFAFVDTATEFALGACPTIDFQQPASNGSGSVVKTLETDSNYVKAALLLYQITGKASYLQKAQTKYAAIRKYFLDPSVALYTVYVLDDGKSCTQVPRRFYASVNGNMIWNGIALASATSDATYLADAEATGQAVGRHLSDAAGAYADLQTDDDVIEPLIEGMYQLATTQHQAFARTWLMTNAQAMAADRALDGAYGRFFDGPAPTGQITEWQSNGGLALAFVAGALSPTAVATANAGAWKNAAFVSDDLRTLPSSIRFTGRAIAVFGTLAETSTQLGQATVLVDGVETFDQTGIHQDESNAFGPVPDSVLFAWRWPDSGPHTVSFQAGPADPKDGGPFLHVQGYAYVP